MESRNYLYTTRLLDVRPIAITLTDGCDVRTTAKYHGFDSFPAFHGH